MAKARPFAALRTGRSPGVWVAAPDASSMEASLLGRPATCDVTWPRPAGQQPRGAAPARLAAAPGAPVRPRRHLIDTMPILADLAAEVLEQVYGMSRDLWPRPLPVDLGHPFHPPAGRHLPGRRAQPRAPRPASRRPSPPAAARPASPPTPAGPCWSCARAAPASWSRRTTASTTSPPSPGPATSPSTWCSATTATAWPRGAPTSPAPPPSSAPTCDEMVLVGDSLHDGEIAEREGRALRGRDRHLLARALRPAVPGTAGGRPPGRARARLRLSPAA